MKLYKPLFSLLVSILAILISSNAYPCTTFVLRTEKGVVFGRNLDWITGTGLVLTNPRNLEKIALVDPQKGQLIGSQNLVASLLIRSEEICHMVE